MKENVLSAEDIKKAISAQLRAARGMRQLSLRNAAKRLDISPSYLSQLENAERNLSLELLFRASKTYGVSVDVLLGREELPGISSGKRIFGLLAGFFKPIVNSAT